MIKRSVFISIKKLKQMKKIFTALLIIIYLNVNAQKSTLDIRYRDFLGTDGSGGYVSLDQKGKKIQIHNMDSLTAIQLLYDKIREKQGEYNEVLEQLVQAQKTIDASVKYFNTTPYIYPNKQYKFYVKSLKQFGYTENKQPKKK